MSRFAGLGEKIAASLEVDIDRSGGSE